MNKFFNFFIFILFLNAFYFYPSNYVSGIEISGQATVIDGDTIKINNEKIRFQGMDAFETDQKCERNNGIKYKCGEIATSDLLLIISNQPVNCVAKKKDRYKRWLATCYVYKLDIGENMVLLGHAFSFMSKKYKQAENEAKKVNAGAWGGNFDYPWEWRKKNR